MSTVTVRAWKVTVPGGFCLTYEDILVFVPEDETMPYDITELTYGYVVANTADVLRRMLQYNYNTVFSEAISEAVEDWVEGASVQECRSMGFATRPEAKRITVELPAALQPIVGRRVDDRHSLPLHLQSTRTYPQRVTLPPVETHVSDDCRELPVGPGNESGVRDCEIESDERKCGPVVEVHPGSGNAGSESAPLQHSSGCVVVGQLFVGGALTPAGPIRYYGEYCTAQNYRQRLEEKIREGVTAGGDYFPFGYCALALIAEHQWLQALELMPDDFCSFEIDKFLLTERTDLAIDVIGSHAHIYFGGTLSAAQVLRQIGGYQLFHQRPHRLKSTAMIKCGSLLAYTSAVAICAASMYNLFTVPGQDLALPVVSLIAVVMATVALCYYWL
jgi:hypothetical protein